MSIYAIILGIIGVLLLIWVSAYLYGYAAGRTDEREHVRWLRDKVE